jgi:PAS domain S-box-containing protein
MKKESESIANIRTLARSQPLFIKKKSERPARWFCFMIAAMIFVLGPASDACNAAGNSPEVRVGSELAFPPYALVDEKGQPAGFSVELIKAVTDTMGLSVKVSSGSWDTMWNSLVSGQIDVLPIVAKTSERQHLVDFSLPHTETYDAFFVREGDTTIPNIAAAQGKEIVVMRSDVAHHQLMERNFQGNLILVDSIPAGLSLISSGKHSAFLCSKLIGTLSIKVHGIKGLTAGPTIPDYKRVFSFAVKKGDRELLEKLNQGLLIVKTNGEYNRIYDKWLSFDDPWRRVQKYLLPVMITVIAIALIAVFWLMALGRLVNKRTRELAEKNEMLHHAYDNLEALIQERTADLVQSNQSLLSETTKHKQTAEALRLEKHFAESLLETAQTIVLVLDTSGQIISINSYMEELSGYPLKEVQGKDWFSTFLPERDQNRTRELFLKAINDSPTHGNVNAIVTKDGRERQIEWYDKTLRDGKGNKTGLLSIGQDITVRKRDEEELKGNEERYRLLFEEAQDGIALADAETGEIVACNQALCRMVEKDKIELVGQPQRILHPQSQLINGHSSSFRAQKIGDPGQILEDNLLSKSGKMIQVEIRASRFRMKERDYLIGVFRDITERKKAEEALRTQNKTFSQVLNGLDALVYVVDMKTYEILFINTYGQNIWGDITGKVCWQTIQTGLAAPCEFCTNSKLIGPDGNPTEGVVWEFQNTVNNRWYDCRDRAVYWPDGRIVRMEIATDITDRKRAEEAQRESEEKYRTLVETTQDLIYATDRKGFLTYMNPTLKRTLGYAHDELNGKNFGQIVAPECIDSTKDIFRRAMRGEHIPVYEVDLIREAGTRLSVEFNVSTIYDNEGKPAGRYGIGRDITERKIIAEKLRISERDLRVLIGKNVDGLIIVDNDGTLRFMNPAAELLFGRKAENLIGKDMGLPLVSGEATEMEISRKDRAQCTVEMRTASISWEEKEAFLVSLRDITERKQVEENIRKSLLGAVRAIASIVELKDPYTAGHQRRVSTLSLVIAQEMKLEQEQCEGIRIAGMIHDIGKVSIPSEILNKPGKISALEFSMIRGHAQAGFDILKDLDFPWSIDHMILQHHERVNGSGYPQGLSGKDILLEARIIAVADVVEAMATHRPYRAAVGIDQALGEITKNRGVFYDTEVVDVCLRIFREKRFKFDVG